MALQIKWTEEAAAQYDKIRSAANEAQSKPQRQENEVLATRRAAETGSQDNPAIRDNPKHPGLETHQYSDLENPYDKKQKVGRPTFKTKHPAPTSLWCYGPRRGWLTLFLLHRTPNRCLRQERGFAEKRERIRRHWPPRISARNKRLLLPTCYPGWFPVFS